MIRLTRSEQSLIYIGLGESMVPSEGIAATRTHPTARSPLNAFFKIILTHLLESFSALRASFYRPVPTPQPGESAPIRLMCFVDLVQDIDLILPVAVAARDSGRFNVVICQTSWLLDLSPRVTSLLAAAGFDPLVVSRRAIQAGAKPDVTSIDALLISSESTAEPHRFGHALAKRANSQNVRTFVMQHGLENIGLTYRDPQGDHDFASNHILTWGDPRNLPDWVPAERRRRCIGVGTPKPAHDIPARDLPLPPDHPPLIGVFENLHWERYSPEYVAAFLADLSTTVTAHPELLFLIKPHHAGRWLAKNPDMFNRSTPNLILADPLDPRWEPFTAGAIIERAAAVITTPSTVALDAARIDCPVAVAGYDLELPVYASLPILRQVADWSGFLADALAPDHAKLRNRLQEFSTRHLLEGDACAAILAAIADNVIPRRASVPSAHA